MKEKSEVAKCFKDFYKMIATQFQIETQVFKINSGKEYFNSNSISLIDKGVIHQSTCVETTQ